MSAARRREREPLPLFHPDFQHSDSRPYGGGHRRSRKFKGSHPLVLEDILGMPGMVPRTFYEDHTLERCTLPLKPDPGCPAGGLMLDMRRLTSMRGSRVELSAVTVFRHGLCQSFDLGIKLAGLEDAALCRGAWERVDLGRLEGALLPLFSPVGISGQQGRDIKPTDMFSRKFWPLSAEPAAGNHAFALRPAVLVAMTNSKRRDATADMMAVGYLASPRAFNPIEADGRPGVWLGNAVHAGYQATAYYFLVVRALGKLSLKMGAGNPMDDTLWRWAAWKEACGDDVPPKTGLSDITMHGGAITRAVLRRPIATVGAQLAAWRAAGELEGRLLSAARLEDTTSTALEGLDARKALLIEHVLRGTPMEYLLDDTDPGDELLQWRVRVPAGGGKALYDELVRWASDPAFSAWFDQVDMS